MGGLVLFQLKVQEQLSLCKILLINFVFEAISQKQRAQSRDQVLGDHLVLHCNPGDAWSKWSIDSCRSATQEVPLTVGGVLWKQSDESFSTHRKQK